MAEAVATNSLMLQTEQIMQSRLMRNMGLLIGLAGAVAIGIVVALWSQKPDYAPLYSGLADRDAGEVVEALRTAGIPFQVDAGQGVIMVERAQVHEARMKLAAQGLPNGDSAGLEMLQREQEIGTSQFMENARYHHALEVDLARTIASVRSIESVRVHLALPKQSVFVRERVKPSASVLVKLFPGRMLEPHQVSAIVHLVASSVPQLEPGQVAVVDQMGRLLSDAGADNELGMSAKQYEYTRKLEADLSTRLVGLMEPIIGVGRVRAQVSADLDFSRNESTQERFDPQGRVIRSEQINEQESRPGNEAIGIPGALSNQPPGAGTTDPALAEGAGLQPPAGNQTRSAVRNYEIDRIVSHTRQSPGAIRRLTVALVVDEPTTLNDAGEVVPQPYTEEQIAKFTELARQAIGFDAQRGDTVSVISSSFLQPEIEPLPAEPLWEQPWLWSLARQVAGGIFVLLLLFVVVRPVVRSLTTPPPVEVKTGARAGDSEITNDQLSLSGPGRERQALPPGATAAAAYEDKLGYARKAAVEDPRRVANVVKTWVGSDA